MKINNPNWLTLLILYDGIYPERIRKMAEKIEVPVEEIAKTKNLDGKAIGLHTIRREVVQRILCFSQLPDDPKKTVVEFLDGSYTVIYMNHKKLIRLVDEFLKLEPTIELISLDEYDEIYIDEPVTEEPNDE